MKKNTKIHHPQGIKTAAPGKNNGFKAPAQESGFTSAADRITPSEPQPSWPK